MELEKIKAKEREIEEREKPLPPTGVLFPGQGTQSVGMGKLLVDGPHGDAAREVYEKASAVLGYDLLDICVNGPKAKLDNTVHSQPALLLAGLAGVEKLRNDSPGTVSDASCTAGLSLGEYTALVFAGAMTFEDALKVVKVRAESMSAAATAGEPHGMLSVVGLSDDDLNAICAQVRQKLGKDTVCQVANHLFPQGRVVSGHKTALEEVQKLATNKGALKAQAVAVSGAFHSPLMKSAYDALKEVLTTVTIKAPRIPVYSNVTAEPYKNVKDMKALLLKQMTSPVQWEKTFNVFLEIATGFIEPGPGEQLKAMMKRIDKRAFENFINLPV